VRIAYLVTCYPAASHSFIRREIAAVELAGGTVFRFSVRPADLAALPDVRDQLEYRKTTVILNQLLLSLILNLLLKMVLSPKRFWQAATISFTNSGFRPSDVVRRIAYLAEAAWLSRRLAQQGITHVHAHFGTNSAMVARLCRKLGGPPYSFTVHGPDEFDRPIDLDLKGKVADSAFCVAISSFGRGQLMRWSRVVDWPKIEVVRCGVDDDFILNSEISDVTAEPKICAVARLSGQKGIPLLIDAAARLKQEGINFSIVLVGGGEMQSEIEAMISDYELEKFVSIAGWSNSEQVLHHLLTSRAMVLPSFAEGLPVAIMESLALKRPVIVSAIAGTPELVDHRCGWLIPSGSVEALGDALREALLASPNKLSAMGAAGRKRVISLHNSAHNGADLYQLFMQYDGNEF
jgi:colanic acid/amylovoran biosynthesis glycosyltransferase